MSLIHFHRFLIASAIIFCLGFAVWVFLIYLRTGGLGTFALAAAFGVAGIGLAYYLVRLRQFVRLPPTGQRSEADTPHHESW